jgi:hypothetical protein
VAITSVHVANTRLRAWRSETSDAVSTAAVNLSSAWLNWLTYPRVRSISIGLLCSCGCYFGEYDATNCTSALGSQGLRT